MRDSETKKQNNWQVITQLHINAYDGNLWLRWYFIMFYFFSVVICLNVLLAFAIDMYVSIEKQENEKDKRERRILKELEALERSRKKLGNI